MDNTLKLKGSWLGAVEKAAEAEILRIEMENKNGNVHFLQNFINTLAGNTIAAEAKIINENVSFTKNSVQDIFNEIFSEFKDTKHNIFPYSYRNVKNAISACTRSVSGIPDIQCASNDVKNSWDKADDAWNNTEILRQNCALLKMELKKR